MLKVFICQKVGNLKSFRIYVITHFFLEDTYKETRVRRFDVIGSITGS